jgi:hypothetical protein
MKTLHSLHRTKAKEQTIFPYSFKKISPSYGPGGISPIIGQAVLFKQVSNMFLISCKIEIDLLK